MSANDQAERTTNGIGAFFPEQTYFERISDLQDFIKLTMQARGLP